MKTARVWTALIMLTAIFVAGCGQKSEEPKMTPQTPAPAAGQAAPAPSGAPIAAPAAPGMPVPSATPAAPAAGTPAPTAAPQAPAGK